LPSCFSRAYSNVGTHCKAAAAIGLTSHLGRGTCKFHFYSPSQKTGLLQGRSMALYERNDFVQSCFFFSPSRHRCIIMCRILHHLDLTMENHAAKHIHVWVDMFVGFLNRMPRSNLPGPPYACAFTPFSHGCRTLSLSSPSPCSLSCPLTNR